MLLLLLTSASILLLAIVAASQAATILDIAKSLPQFSTLVAAASKAGIADLLSAPGFKTVFAPTNDAFAQLGNTTAAWILNEHNQQHLLSTLYYHIAPGALTSSTFRPGQEITTLDSTREGDLRVQITGSGSSTRVNNARITTFDVIASNGVIQVIDRVLVPANIDIPQNDIVHTAIAVPALSTLVKAVVAAGLVPALSNPNGPYVVFAPTDEAFAAVPSKVLECLLKNVEALKSVLLLHVVSGQVYSEQVSNGAVVTTLAGKPLTLDVKGATVTVTINSRIPSSNVVIPNVDTSNGVVHVIDRVLFDNTGPCAV